MIVNNPNSNSEFKNKVNPHFNFIKNELELENDLRNYSDKLKTYSRDIPGFEKIKASEVSQIYISK